MLAAGGLLSASVQGRQTGGRRARPSTSSSSHVRSVCEIGVPLDRIMELMGIAANAMVSRYAHDRAQRLIEAVPMLDGESSRDMQPASTTARPSRYIHQIICDTSRPSIRIWNCSVRSSFRLLYYHESSWFTISAQYRHRPAGGAHAVVLPRGLCVREPHSTRFRWMSMSRGRWRSATTTATLGVP